jgi:dynein heavy chain
LKPSDFKNSNLGGLCSLFTVLRASEDPSKASKNSYQRTLELAIKTGMTVLLEDVSSELDPGLDSILTKAVSEEEKGVRRLNFGDKAVEYNDNFRFLMTTKLANPHFLPETCIKTTVINFSVTFKGLEDQLLVDVINVLLPALEEKRDQLVVEIAQQRNFLYEKQSEILQRLADSSADTVLDDEHLIDTLEKVKVSSKTTQENLNDAVETEKEINDKRNMHREVAVRGSILYFAIVDMAAINDMY